VLSATLKGRCRVSRSNVNFSISNNPYFNGNGAGCIVSVSLNVSFEITPAGGETQPLNRRPGQIGVSRATDGRKMADEDDGLAPGLRRILGVYSLEEYKQNLQVRRVQMLVFTGLFLPVALIFWYMKWSPEILVLYMVLLQVFVLTYLPTIMKRKRQR
jgi:hypothetical protein